MALVKYKKLTKARGITVPKDLAANVGLIAGTAVDRVECDEGILLRKHVPSCVFCGSIESVDTVKGKEVCAKCAGEMRKEINEKYA